MAKLRRVNTTDIRAAIELGCRTMSSVFNADDRDIPFFGSVVRPEARLSFSELHSESHVPGRHLNALLTAEHVAGVTLDERAVEKHARAAFFSYSGSVPLPLNRAHVGGPLVNFTDHNVREGFHALYALARFRDSDRAREVAASSIAAIFEYWHPARGWERERLAREHGIRWVRDETFISGLGRALGPLVKYYRATGYSPALELALLLAEKALAEFFRPDGVFDPRTFGTHTHSTTSVLSSLAQLADLLGDAALIERVKAFYERGLWQIRDELGWVIENTAHGLPDDRGECNNSGDVLETALILGRWGSPEAYHDAERILRGHLLPAQLLDTSFIAKPPNPAGQDGLRDLARRHLGAFGFPAPYGQQPVGLSEVNFNMDIVGGAVASLCEAYREAARSDATGHHVCLLFDHETAALKVGSHYPSGVLSVTMKRPGPLWVRLPPWVAPGRVEVDGVTDAPRCLRGFLFFSEPPLGRAIQVRVPLSEHEIVLRHRSRDIRVRLRGDQVLAMDSFGADLTFFDPIAP